MGYHVTEIPRGEYGEFSKIVEEFLELQDAHDQGGKILELVELSDLLGAMAGYVHKHYNLSIEDVAVMTRMTSSAFKEGKR